MIRPATMVDKEIVTSISRQAWNDGTEDYEYIPRVFDKWVEDKAGQFVVAEYDNKVVGCAKLTLTAPAEAWLEGLRVDSSAQGLGIGKALQKYFINQSDQFSSMRLSTYIGNDAALHIIEKQGFVRQANFTILEAKVVGGAIEDSVEVVKKIDLVWEYLDHERLKENNYFIGFEWLFQPLSYSLLQQLIDNNAVYGVFNTYKQLTALMIFSNQYCKESGYCINYLQFDSVAAATSLISYAKTITSAAAIKLLITMCPDNAELREVFKHNDFYGYDSHINNVFVYELNHHRKG